MNDHRTTCDPGRIELFLEQKLSDEEQSVFESHLSSCGDCRQRLETAAATKTFGPNSASPCETTNCLPSVCSRAIQIQQARTLPAARPRC